MSASDANSVSSGSCYPCGHPLMNSRFVKTKQHPKGLYVCGICWDAKHTDPHKGKSASELADELSLEELERRCQNPDAEFAATTATGRHVGYVAFPVDAPCPGTYEMIELTLPPADEMQEDMLREFDRISVDAVYNAYKIPKELLDAAPGLSWHASMVAMMSQQVQDDIEHLMAEIYPAGGFSIGGHCRGSVDD